MSAAPATLRLLRKTAGQSLSDAAAQIGVHPASLSRYESGRREPEDATVVRRLALTYLEQAERRADEAKKLVKDLL